MDKIAKLNLGSFFDILEGEIRGANGSLIVFKGMQAYNAENIKSLEDFDLAWVEEAQTFSEKSLRLLRPTIRKEESELWFSWNSRHDTDPVDKFFRGGAPRKGMVAVPVNWYDNPWFPEVLRDEKDGDYADDPEVAEHVWGGAYEIISAGSYFGKQVAAAEREKRVGYFPHIVGLPVFPAWDLGVDDYTAIWFFQIPSASRVRVIDYYEASGLGAEDILAEALPEYSTDVGRRLDAFAELGRDDPFKYGRFFLPHDIGMREWGAGAKTRAQTLNILGVPLDLMHRGVAQNPEERINATRRLLPLCEFHQSKRVMLGLSRLRRYVRKMNEALGTYVGPLHDENSHGADAFGEFAVNCGIAPPKPPEKPKPKMQTGQVFLPGPPEPVRGTRIRV